MNLVLLQGRLRQPPEIRRQRRNGRIACVYAFLEVVREPASGESYRRQPTMDAVKVVAWEEVAEGLSGCEMGQSVFVIGHLRQRRWQPEDDLPLETHVVVTSQVYTDVIVDRTPIDCMDATPRPS